MLRLDFGQLRLILVRPIGRLPDDGAAGAALRHDGFGLRKLLTSLAFCSGEFFATISTLGGALSIFAAPGATIVSGRPSCARFRSRSRYLGGGMDGGERDGDLIARLRKRGR
jgi:hypothetical protein